MNRIEELKKQATYEIMGVPQLDAKQFAELLLADGHTEHHHLVT